MREIGELKEANKRREQLKRDIENYIKKGGKIEVIKLGKQVGIFNYN